MNRRQIIVMWMGILVMVGMCVYPPWTKGYTRSKGWAPDGYALIFLRPDYGYAERRDRLIIRIDMTRLIVQEAAVVLLFGGLFMTLKDRKATGREAAAPP